MIEGIVNFVEYLGKVTNIYLDIPGSVKLILVKIPGVQPLKKGGK